MPETTTPAVGAHDQRPGATHHLDVSEYDAIAAYLAACAKINAADWPSRQAEEQAFAALDVFLTGLGFKLEDGAARGPSSRLWDLSADVPEMIDPEQGTEL